MNNDNDKHENMIYAGYYIWFTGISGNGEDLHSDFIIVKKGTREILHRTNIVGDAISWIDQIKKQTEINYQAEKEGSWSRR